MKNDGSILNGSEVLLLACLFVCLLFWLSFFQEGQDQESGPGIRTGGQDRGQDRGSGQGVRTGGLGQRVRTGGPGQGCQDRGVRTGGLEQETDPVCLVD